METVAILAHSEMECAHSPTRNIYNEGGSCPFQCLAKLKWGLVQLDCRCSQVINGTAPMSSVRNFAQTDDNYYYNY